MIQRIIQMQFIVLLLLAGCVQEPEARLEEGRWTGQILRPTGEYMNFFLDVDDVGDSLDIKLEVPRFPTFQLYDAQIEGDYLSFSWQTGMRLNCGVKRQENRIFLGVCLDPLGGRGPMLIIPPGADTTAFELNQEDYFVDFEIPELPKSLSELISEEETAPGTLVDIGGRKLNLRITGEGDVTVVFENGMGDDLGVWKKVMSELPDVRLVGYDRAGIGYSDPGPAVFEVEETARDLHAALQGAGVEAPYVLVGHAEGAFVTRTFASLFPDEIAGMVLVDPAHELLGARLAALDDESWEKYMDQKKTFFATLQSSWYPEFKGFTEIVETQTLPGAEDVPDVAVAVLSALRESESPRWIGETEKGLAAKRALHKELIENASLGKLFEVEDSGPYVHREKPALVAEAVKWVLDVIKTPG